MREHWRVKATRAKGQKDWVTLALLQHGKAKTFALPGKVTFTVTFTRYGKRLLDSDNLAGAFKAIRDAVAAWLGYGDGPKDPIEWHYQQFTLKALEGLSSTKGWQCAVRIEVTCQASMI